MTTFDPADTSRWTDPDHSGYTDDEWHAHTGEAAPEESHGSVAPAAIFAVGLVGFLVVVACVLVISQYFIMQSQKQIAMKQEVDISSSYRSTRASWEEQLSGYGWADPAAGKVRIPIDVAITKVATRYAQSPADVN